MVAVIASFALVHSSITATLDQTGIRAAITHIGVRVVAGFKAFGAFF